MSFILLESIETKCRNNKNNINPLDRNTSSHNWMRFKSVELTEQFVSCVQSVYVQSNLETMNCSTEQKVKRCS